jgi:copper chaperone CopZ
MSQTTLFFTQGSSMKTETLKVTGMTSEAATTDVIRALSRVNGVQTVQVSYTGKTATVLFDENRTAKQELMAALAGAGFSRDVFKEMEVAQGSCCGGCCYS